MLLEDLIVIDWPHLRILLLRINPQYIQKYAAEAHLVVFGCCLIQGSIQLKIFPPQFQLDQNFLLS